MAKDYIKLLFICAWGESRSKYFSETTNLNMDGFKSKYCGFDSEAKIKIDERLSKWADEIIVLDKDFDKFTYHNKLLKQNKRLINYHIEDIPKTFRKKYNEFASFYNRYHRNEIQLD